VARCRRGNWRRRAARDLQLTATRTQQVVRPPVRERLLRIAAWIGGLALLGLACQALGVDLRGWIEQLFDAVAQISVGYLVLGLTLQTVQTGLVGLAWVAILRAAYPAAVVDTWQVITCYAVAVALNGVLPANIGSFTMLFMFLALVAGSTFPGVLSGFFVHKLFFVVAGAGVYLYLFVSVPGSFDVSLSGLGDHWLLAVLVAAGVLLLLTVVARAFWHSLVKLWDRAKQGGAVLATPRIYAGRVLLPEIVGYAAKLGVVATFLAAYGVPVSFDAVMHVVGSSSIANSVSVTPGGVGVTQAANVVALHGITDSATATAYSLGQQLVTTAWNMLVAVALVAVVFGWRGGKQLVETSYGGAKEKVVEMRGQRRRYRGAR
jgi:uncharacterized membrane protein YbhN (UPF0104 family)